MRLKMLKPRVSTVNTRFGRAVEPAVDRSFYATPQWRELRDQVVEAAGRRCQWPGCGRSDGRMHADHIVEIKDGGAALDRANLWCLCQTHHNGKTADAARARS